MDNLYREIRKKAKYSRNRDVRIKLELILLALKLGSVTLACQRMGFSRKFYYRWWTRFKKAKYEVWALEERSRCPKKSPKRINKSIERAIRWYQRKDYGSRMIEAMLRREGIRVSKSTICHVLNKRKRRVLRVKRVKFKKHQKRYELVVPGERLQIDVKYVPELVGGVRAYNYVAVDESTRWRFAKAYDSLNQFSTVEFLNELEKAVPFPIQAIQTDNGHEFTFKLLGENAKKHAMERWCEARSIKLTQIPPGVKELNGKVERSHRIDEQYFYWKAPTNTLEEFNLALKRWMRFYNYKRIHAGIDYLTPMEKLVERQKALQSRLSNPELELKRLKFIAPLSVKKDKRTTQLERLELELKKLYLAA